MIDCSSGGIVPGVQIPARPWISGFVRGPNPATYGNYDGAVGMITSATQADNILGEDKAIQSNTELSQ